MYMVKKLANRGQRVTPRFKAQRKTYLRQWRGDKTLESVAERLTEEYGLDITHASLSRIERGLQPYNQRLLEALAIEYRAGDPASLLMRDPTDPEGIWSIWDKALPGQKKTIVEISKTVLKTGTEN